MKRFSVFVFMFLLVISAFADRAYESSKKADDECMSFTEWKESQGRFSRAHESAKRTKE